MPRGRKPKPTYLKLITGNPGRRRLPANEVQPAPACPPPPEHLCFEAKAEWQRVSPELFALRLLTRLDTAVLGAYCQSYAMWVQATDAINAIARTDPRTKGLIAKINGHPQQSPLVFIANKAASDMARYAAEFGMTPSARARLSGGIEIRGPSKFDGLIGGWRGNLDGPWSA